MVSLWHEIFALYLSYACISRMQSTEHSQLPSTESQPPTKEEKEGSETEDDVLQSPVTKSIQSGAKTSDFYSVKNIPERFNHPG